MYRIILALLFGSFAWQSIAQPACTVNYQAVARDADDNIYATRNLGVQIRILSGSTGGPAVYVENHAPTTSSLGLFTLEIGGGNVESGNWEAIDWSAGGYFLEVLMDVNGGTNYSPIGTSPILAVPIASYAKTASYAASTPPQCLEFAVDVDECGFVGKLSISGKPDTFYFDDLDPWNELQYFEWNQELGMLLVSDLYGKARDSIAIPTGGHLPDPLEVSKLIVDTICINHPDEDAEMIIHDNRVYASNDILDISWGMDEIDPAYTLEVDEIPVDAIVKELNQMTRGFFDTAIPSFESVQMKLGPYHSISASSTEGVASINWADLLSEFSYEANRTEVREGYCGEKWFEPKEEGEEIKTTEVLMVGPTVVQCRDRMGYDDGISCGTSLFKEGGFQSCQYSQDFEGYNVSNKTVILNSNEDGARMNFRDRDNQLSVNIVGETGVIKANMFMNNGIPNMRTAEPTALYSSSATTSTITTRGVGTLQSGEAIIQLDDIFLSNAKTGSMTVSLTSHSADTYGLAVIEKTDQGFHVKELAGGIGDFAFDWEVKCERLMKASVQPPSDQDLYDLDTVIENRSGEISSAARN